MPKIRALDVEANSAAASMEAAVYCDPTKKTIRHDWVYHRSSRTYKCQLCGTMWEKGALKLRTDGEV